MTAIYIAIRAQNVLAGTAGDQLDILYTTDLSGRYVPPDCTIRGTRHPEQTFSQLLSGIDHIRRNIQRTTGKEPIIVHAGNIMRPDIGGPYAFDQPGTSALLGTLLARIHFDAMALGIYDLGAPVRSQRGLFATLLRHRIPLLRTNLRCSDKKDFRCRGKPADTFVVVRRGALRVGIFSVLPQDLRQRVPDKWAGSVSAQNEVRRTRTILRHMRDDLGVDLTILLAQLENTSAIHPLTRFVRNLGQSQPDIIIAGGMRSSLDRHVMRQVRMSEGPIIVGTGRFGKEFGQLHLSIERNHERAHLVSVQAQIHHSSQFLPHSADLVQVLKLRQQLCQRISHPLGKARLAAPMAYQKFIAYLTEIMRTRTHAEIAFLNISAVSKSSFPLWGRLTYESVSRAIRSQSLVGTTQIKGSELASIFKSYHRIRHRLLIRGIEQKNNSWLINGRPLVLNQHYRVALTRFVAKGGENLVRLQSTSFNATGVSLRNLAIGFFQHHHQMKRDGRSIVSLERDFPQLSQKFLFAFSANFGMLFNNVVLNNGDTNPRYDRPLLRRDNIISIASRAHLIASATNVDHRVEVDVMMNYGRLWTRPPAAEKTDAETADRASLTALYRWQSFRRHIAKHDAWYIPDPFFEGALNSEFSSSGRFTDEQGRQRRYRLVDLTGTLGTGWRLIPQLFLKIGPTLRRQLFVPNEARPDVPSRPGMYLGYTLRRISLPISSLDVEFDSRLDAFLTDFSGSTKRELIWESNIYTKIWRSVHLTVSHSFFLFGSGSRPNSLANSIALGINILLDKRHQLF